VRRIRAHDEHARGGVHGGEDAQVRAWAPHAVQGLVRGLALHQADIQRALLEHGDVVGAAARVPRLHLQRGIDGVDGLGEGLSVHGEAAPRCGRAEHDRRAVGGLGAYDHEQRDCERNATLHIFCAASRSLSGSAHSTFMRS
jgi:hypothetical protein